MANDYFNFKQFSIKQNNCGMKVTTDACLFGAWCCNILKNYQPKKILDIGAGTGLLSLMLAQTTHANIVGIEIEENAANKANENVQNTPWKDRVTIIHQPIQEYISSEKFDVIVANPPFFKNSMLSDDVKRNMALHTSQLALPNLKIAVDDLLANDGFFFVLLSNDRQKEIELLMKDYHILFKTFVKQTPKHSFFRTMYCFSKNGINKTENQLIIKNNDDKYSNEFGDLLKEFYLNL